MNSHYIPADYMFQQIYENDLDAVYKHKEDYLEKEVAKESKSSHSKSTYLLYGATGTGKTRLAGSFPKPFFISAAHERGFDTIEALWQKKRELFFDPEFKPINRYVSTPTEYNEAFKEAKALVESGKVLTVVNDTLSAYADGYMDYLKQSGVSGFDLWNSLKDHIRHMMIETHKLNANVIWTAWAAVDEDQGQPMMPTQKLAPVVSGLCKYVLYLRVIDAKEGAKWEIRTKKCGKFDARVRDENIPDPLPGFTYRDFAKSLGYAL